MLVHHGKIPLDATLTQISAGRDYTCAIASNGKAYCWGYNTACRLGIHFADMYSSTPVAVAQGSIPPGVAMTQISAGDSHTCAIASDNKAYCWGGNNYGQLGNVAVRYDESDVPVVVKTDGALAGKTIKQIIPSRYHTCALTSDEHIYCWGNNDSAQLGNGTVTGLSVPTIVSSGTIPLGIIPTQISVGGSHTCALDSNGRAYCWGLNSSGQLGNGATAYSRYTPSPVMMRTDPTITFGGSAYAGTDISMTVPNGSFFTNKLAIKNSAHPVGTVSVIVTNPDGKASAAQGSAPTSANKFIYSDPSNLHDIDDVAHDIDIPRLPNSGLCY